MAIDDVPSKVINRNDNNRSCWLLMGNVEENKKAAVFISQADWLIKQFSPSWWKNHPDQWDYQYAQYGICLKLLNPYPTKEWTLRFISIFLECDALIIMNDGSPELNQMNLVGPF